jgi:hypothetical protein
VVINWEKTYQNLLAQVLPHCFGSSEIRMLLSPRYREVPLLIFSGEGQNILSFMTCFKETGKRSSESDLHVPIFFSNVKLPYLGWYVLKPVNA